MGDISKGVADTLQPAKKIYKKSKINTNEKNQQLNKIEHGRKINKKTTKNTENEGK